MKEITGSIPGRSMDIHDTPKIIIIIIIQILASYDEVYYSWHKFLDKLLLEIISPAIEQLLNRNLNCVMDTPGSQSVFWSSQELQ